MSVIYNKDLLKNKERIKALLGGCERRCVSIISDGLVNKKPRRVIIREIRTTVLGYSKMCGLEEAEYRNLYTEMYKIYHRCSKKTWGKKTPEDIYIVLRKDLIYNREFSKIKNSVANDREHQEKLDFLRELKYTSGSPFYMSDSHKDCARGHLDYENRLYYDEDYEHGYDLDAATVAQIRKYIKKHHLMSIQEVTGEGIWLITRPNCRHRLVSVPLEGILAGKRYKVKEVKLPPSEKGYEDYQRDFYYSRMKLMESLDAVIPNAVLEKDLKKTRRLERKWK